MAYVCVCVCVHVCVCVCVYVVCKSRKGECEFVQDCGVCEWEYALVNVCKRENKIERKHTRML